MDENIIEGTSVGGGDGAAPAQDERPDGAVAESVSDSRGESGRESFVTLPENGAGTVLGYVNFDAGRAASNTCAVLIDFALIDAFRRGKYVTIRRRDDEGDVYLGRLIEGPFFVPDYVSIDSSIARLAIQKAPIISMLPDYHAAAFVELLGIIEGKNLYGLSTRPSPQSAVHAIEGEALIELLGLEGDMELGRLDGYSDIAVNLSSRAKKVLPRNVGIFGTVGSGKTNTSQVLIEQAAQRGWAVMVLDVEGEYCLMNQQQSEVAMVERLSQLGKLPMGIDDFTVYRPVGVPADDEIAEEPFALRFRELSPYMVAELLGMNDTQEDRFLQLWDACTRNPTPPQQPERPGGRRGRQRMQVQPIQNIAEEDSSAASAVESEENEVPVTENDLGVSIQDILEDEPAPHHLTLDSLIERVELWIEQNHDDAGKPLSFPQSWSVVRRLLQRLKRLGLFDTDDNPFRIEDAVKAGAVSVINLSNSNEARINNLVIADILGSVFKYKMRNQDPPVMIVIEEAHTFVSKENVKRMRATMDRLREIARRGRKRWLSLAFISQQPSHLPAELYELCNNLFVHETKGSKNVDALKASAGTVNEAVWSDIPVLGQGRALLISPQFRHSLVAQINPSQTMRRMTD